MVDFGMSHLMDDKIILYVVYIYFCTCEIYLMTKYPQRGDGGDGSRCQIYKFWNPFCTLGTCVVRNFKFGKLVDFGMSHLIDNKIFPPKVVWRALRD